MPAAADPSTAFVEGVGEFAGTFISPLALAIVLVMASLWRRRPMYLRLGGLACGAALALPAAWKAGHLLPAACILGGGMLGVLLQVELVLGVVLPLLALCRRLYDAVLGLFRTPNLPPRP
jgi:hypothetical protein